MRRSHPWPHVLVREAFGDYLYHNLEEEFRRLLALGFANDGRSRSGLFTRNMSGYDAYSINFTPEMTGPFRLFLLRGWHDLLAGLFGIEATGDVNGGLHHHAAGSASGKIHNDFNPGWFVGSSDEQSVNVSDHRLCSYHHGTLLPGGKGLTPREEVRAVAMVYYLNNPPWSPGDGGETGLYRSPRCEIEKPGVAVPPLNNSLLAFECTPYSYHRFLSNRRHERNSVILWLHRTKADAVARWGERSIVCWPKERR